METNKTNQIQNFVKECILEVKKGNNDEDMVIEQIEQLEELE